MKKLGFEILDDKPNKKMFKTTSVWPYKDMVVSILYEKLEKKLWLRFNIKTELDTIYKNNWIQKFKIIWNIVLNRPIEFEAEFEFRGREHILNFVDILDLLSSDVEKEKRRE